MTYVEGKIEIYEGHSMKIFSKTLIILLNVCVSLCSCGMAMAQAYPNKTVRLVVPQSAGGGADILARSVAEKLSKSWGVQVIVDNRLGAAGIIGTQLVAQAAPDGYTLLMGAISTHAINRGLYRNLPYDPVKDFVPITMIASAPLLVVVHPSLPVKSVQELIALARAKPGQLSFASAGSGNSTHLAGEMFKMLANVDILHVPYKGATPAEIDLMAGHASLMFSSILSAMPHSNAGRMRALAVTSARRTSVMPELPTVAESGLAAFDVNPWYGLFAPAGTPREIVDKINREVLGILQLPDVKERFATLGADPAGTTPGEFATFINVEIEKWTRVIKQSGTTVD
jgi:tripartite-type tricarboxylate transporter receptor subunit TctC